MKIDTSNIQKVEKWSQPMILSYWAEYNQKTWQATNPARSQFSDKEIQFLSAIKKQWWSLEEWLAFIESNREKARKLNRAAPWLWNKTYWTDLKQWSVVWGAIAEVPSFIGQTVWWLVSWAESIGRWLWKAQEKIFWLPKTWEPIKIAPSIKKAWQVAKQKIQEAWNIDPTATATKIWEVWTQIGLSVAWWPKLPTKISWLKTWAKTLWALATKWAVEWARYWLWTEWKIDPKEVALSAWFETAIPLLWLGKKTLWKALSKSAMDDISQALWATKKQYKQKAIKIIPEFIKRGIVWSREWLKKISWEWLEKFWQQIDDFVEAWKLDDVVISTKPINDILSDALEETMVSWKVVNQTKYNAIKWLQDVVSQFDEFTGKEARQIRKIFDDIVYATKWGIWIEDMTYKNWLVKSMADALRGQIAKSSPDLAELNKQFSFYKNLNDIVNETLERTSSQTWWLRKWFATAVWWLQQWWWSDRIIWYLASKVFLDATSSSLWKTVSWQLKKRLADAITSWDPTTINKAIKAINDSANVWLLPMLD